MIQPVAGSIPPQKLNASVVAIMGPDAVPARMLRAAWWGVDVMSVKSRSRAFRIGNGCLLACHTKQSKGDIMRARRITVLSVGEREMPFNVARRGIVGGTGKVSLGAPRGHASPRRSCCRYGNRPQGQGASDINSLYARLFRKGVGQADIQQDVAEMERKLARQSAARSLLVSLSRRVQHVRVLYAVEQIGDGRAEGAPDPAGPVSVSA